MQYLQKYDLTLDSNFERLLRRYPKIPWKKFINRENKEIANCDALDFLDKCLLYDHDLRIAPIDAMQHQYMQPVVRLYENIKNG